MQRPLSPPDRLFAEFRRTGDPRALGEVYDRLAPELLGLAVHMTRDTTEAEDLLQATFVVAIEEARRFDPTRRVLPWLVGILGHEARKARERAARRPEPERIEARGEADPLAAAEGAELADHLERGLARVPPAFRPVLRLRLRHGLSVVEIATVLERAPGTVRSQLARGLESLRRALPAGFAAGLLACARPARGLASVRSALVRHASLHGPAGVGSMTAATVLGGLAMKKLVALALVLISALVLWNARGEEARVAELAVAPTALAPAVVEALALETPALEASRGEAVRSGPEEPKARREPVRTAAAPEAREPGTAELLVHALWPDGTPAAGEIVLVSRVGSRPDEALPLPTVAGGARFRGLEPGPTNVRLLRGGETSALLHAGSTTEVSLSITPGVSVDVRVSNALGEPVAGAEVWLSERYRDNLGHGIGRTDARGELSLRSLGPGHYLGARRQGYVPSALRGVRGASGDRLGIELVLADTGASLQGLVLDPHGRGIEGAWVLVGRETPDSLRLADGNGTPAAPPLRLRTDEGGRFESAMVAPGVQPIQARAAGFAALATSVEVLEGGPNECLLMLEPEACLIGRVVGMDGEPLPATRIQVGEDERFAGVDTWSDAGGRFTLHGLAGGEHLAGATHPRQGHAERELHLTPGATEEWQVVLGPTPLLEGRVLDARGEPRADLVVVAMPGGDRARRVRSSRTDAEGRFLLSGLENRDHLLWVQQPGGWNEFPLLEIEDARPGGAELVLRLPDERQDGRIVLQVTSPDGTPLSGAELQTWHVERELWRSFASGGETGAIAAENVPPGTLELELRHPQHPWKQLGRHPLAAGETLDLGRIALEPSGALRARLRGLSDERMAALTAVLCDSSGGDASGQERGVARITPGLLTTSPLAAGEYLLLLGAEGVRQLRCPFTIEAGRETELELVLMTSGVRTVQLHVPEGAPSPRWIRCSLQDDGAGIVWVGKADCSQDPPAVRVSAPPGSFQLRAEGPGGLRGVMELVLPAEGVELPPFVLPLHER